jgi:hypothetical protein
LKVGDRWYGAEHFEPLFTSCGTERLFRYNGPLEPRQIHEISLPGTVDYSRPLHFTLTFFVGEAPVVDAGQEVADAGDPASLADTGGQPSSTDAGPLSAPQRTGRHTGGCSYAPRTRGSACPAAFVLALALLSLRRASRRAR